MPSFSFTERTVADLSLHQKPGDIGSNTSYGTPQQQGR